jgi:hypothetical protein
MLQPMAAMAALTWLIYIPAARRAPAVAKDG